MFRLSLVLLAIIFAGIIDVAPAWANKNVTRYIIVPNDATTTRIAGDCSTRKECAHRRLNRTRLSCDGTMRVLKWNQARLRKTPTDLDSYVRTNSVKIMTHAETRAIVTTPAWDCPITAR